MMTNQENPYGNAAQAYKQAGQKALNPVEIVVALYEGIIRNLDEAKAAYGGNDLEKMCRINEKTFRILSALQSHLDFEQGGDTAPALNDFYKIIFVRLTKILEHDDPAQEFDYLKNNVHEVYAKWSLLSRKISDQQKTMIEEGQTSIQQQS
ncbi:MAG: flagellar export chaperone FliS [Alphaproteobacteria bacterium]